MILALQMFVPTIDVWYVASVGEDQQRKAPFLIYKVHRERTAFEFGNSLSKSDMDIASHICSFGMLHYEYRETTR